MGFSSSVIGSCIHAGNKAVISGLVYKTSSRVLEAADIPRTHTLANEISNKEMFCIIK